MRIRLAALGDWLDRRVGFRRPLDGQREKRLPEGTGWLHTLGTLALAFLVLQGITGALLALNYAPTPDHALDSVRHIETLPFGRFLRALHHWGASFLVVAVFLHLLRVFVWGGYKRPRELLWIAGVLLGLLVMAFGFTGYLLPWDKKGFWATVVGTEVAGTLPVAGPFLAGLLRGGEEVSAPTLTRFYAVHVILLPALTILLVAFHLLLVHRQETSPVFRSGEAAQKPVRFWPDHVAKESVVVFAGLVALVLWAALVRAPLEGPPDPSEASYDPRPDWYFLFLYQTLKLFSGRWEWVSTALLPLAGLVLLLALPFLDRNPERHPRRRPVAMAAGALGVACLVGMTLWASAERPAVRAPQAAVLALGQQGPDQGEPPPGRRIMEESGCLVCHRIKGEGESEGPDLTHVGSRLTADYMRSFIRDPRSLRPDAKMEPQDFLSDEELDLVVAYLAGLR